MIVLINDTVSTANVVWRPVVVYENRHESVEMQEVVLVHFKAPIRNSLEVHLAATRRFVMFPV
jgi:hypothetical protein